MSHGLENFALDVMAGRSPSLAGSLARTGLSVVEPFYATAMAARNVAYDHGLFRSFALGKPTIAVGNLTTGGTGKTPVVVWLTDRLRRAGHRPAVLMRGYRATGDSDERLLIASKLPEIPVIANPSRVEGAVSAGPDVTAFVLDDGFQHRKVRRDFDLVLVSATRPFGFDHVLPRGLLRERTTGLRRASAVLITRASMIPTAELAALKNRVRHLAPAVPVFAADHVQTSITDGSRSIPLEDFRGRSAVTITGIGEPGPFVRQLESAGVKVVGSHAFGDHHAYTAADVSAVLASAGPSLILTTEKDWTKLARLVPADAKNRVFAVDLSIRFYGNDETELFDLIQRRLIDVASLTKKTDSRQDAKTQT